MLKTKLKTGDKVKVIAGKYKWITKDNSDDKKKPLIDYISQIDLKKQIVYLKKARQKKNGNAMTFAPIHISNVAYWLENKKTTTKINFCNSKKKGKIRKSRKFSTEII